ncbi:target of EGR1 protein 1 [Nelusetta ayraudi]|uniref:target of EGR1 protein 1 n=1 Tax=Nelusetta ayraudi TaxID=303726 RepID=UPI003F6FAD1F
MTSYVVPVIDVQNDNFKELWPAILLSIKTSSFIAVDTELSGLGNRKSLVADSIEDRYKAICHAARSRSILSLGIACYKKQDEKAADTYLVQVYNLTLLCSEEYIIEPQSVQFLVQHGFDFNKQYASGIPYCKGNNKGGTDDRGVHIRALFTELLRAKKPLVLHNGLIDMAFLYQCFYAHLPERLATFTADLTEMFPAGIYDTKHVTKFELCFTASYLEYAYKKCKLDNSRALTSGGNGPHVRLEFCQYAGHMSSYVDYRDCPAVSTSREGRADICQCYAVCGWCTNGTKCPLSHDTERIILWHENDTKKSKRKRKRQQERKGGGDPESKVPHMEVDDAPDDQQRAPESLADGEEEEEEEEEKEEKTTTTTTTEEEVHRDDGDVGRGADQPADGPKKNPDSGLHRAGFDAFMTGFILAHACALTKRDGASEQQQQQEQEQQQLPSCLNKVYLSRKTVSLNVVKSSFSKSSKAHLQKMEMVWGPGA